MFIQGYTHDTVMRKLDIVQSFGYRAVCGRQNFWSGWLCKEITAMKCCKHDEYESFEHLLIFFLPSSHPPSSPCSILLSNYQITFTLHN